MSRNRKACWTTPRIPSPPTANTTDRTRRDIAGPGLVLQPEWHAQLRSGNQRTGSSRRKHADLKAWRQAGKNPPKLIVSYTPPPTKIVVPLEVVPVVLDGLCDVSEYAGAEQFAFVDFDQSIRQLLSEAGS